MAKLVDDAKRIRRGLKNIWDIFWCMHYAVRCYLFSRIREIFFGAVASSTLTHMQSHNGPNEMDEPKTVPTRL